MVENDLEVLRNGFFLGYNQDVNPHLAAEFSTAAFRFGHTLLRSFITKVDNKMVNFDNLTLSSIMFKNNEAYTNGGLDSICRGLMFDSATSFDSHITNEIQNHLFESNSFDSQSTRRFSLSAINIMRLIF
jgi:peroxidase